MSGKSLPADMPSLAGVAHRWVTAGELEVHVAEAGSGDPIVLLHGWPEHWWCWRELIPELARTHRVIAPDLRGLGWTSAPEDGYEKHQLARDLIALLDALGLDRVKLMGHDWGAWTGFLACIDAPQRFERYVALAIAPPWRKVDTKAALNPRMIYQPVMASPLGRRLQRSPRFMRTLYAKGAGDPSFITDDAIGPYLSRFADPAVARAGSKYYSSLLRHEVPMLRKGTYETRPLRVPTLLLYGSEDRIIAPLMRDFEPDADHDVRVEAIAGAGHWLPEERPAEVTERALAFFAG